MADGLTFKMEGLDDVIKALRKAEEKELRQTVFNEGKKITKEIRDDAKAACPYVSGNLKSAIRSRNSKKKLTFSVYVSDKKAYYAPFVEYGTKEHSKGGKTKTGARREHTYDRKKRNAKPFLIPAGRKHTKEFYDSMEKALLKVAAEVTR